MTDAPPASYGTGAPSKDSYSGKENRKVQVGEVGLSSDGKLKLREAREEDPGPCSSVHCMGLTL